MIDRVKLSAVRLRVASHWETAESHTILFWTCIFLKFLSKNLTWLTLCNKAISFYEKNWRFIVAVSRDFLAFFSWIEPNWVPYKHVKILVNPKNSFSRRYLRNKWQCAESTLKKMYSTYMRNMLIFWKIFGNPKSTPNSLTLRGFRLHAG